MRQVNTIIILLVGSGRVSDEAVFVVKVIKKQEY